MSKQVFMASGLTGGTAGLLDDILHTSLEDGNIAIVTDTTNSITYYYKYSDSETGSEDSPDIIIPDSNTSGTGAWVLLTSSNSKKLTKVIEIGDWNMDSTESVNVNHGLTLANIIGIRVLIRNDTATQHLPVDFNNAGLFTAYAAYVTLLRVASGIFDSTSFDSTSFNRGWIIIDYLE